MRLPAALTLALTASLAGAASAQTVSGEVQPRTEVRRVDGRTDAFTSMRTRLAVARDLAFPGRVFVQLQDVRVWGGEASTTDASADALDLHQGWVEFGARGDSPFWVRVGRQEIAYGTERLVGAPDWLQQSRSFDGVRGTVRAGEAAWVDLFATQVAEDEASGGGDALFGGVWGEAPVGGDGRLAAYLLVEEEGRSGRRDRRTAGTEIDLVTGPVEFMVEAAVQDTEGVDGTASLLAARAGIAPGGASLRLTAGFDRTSGTTPGEAGVAFSRLYGRSHRFYGYADLFRDLDADTGGRGLVDLLVRARWPLAEGVSMQIDAHRFRVTEGAGLEDARLADEIDLLARWGAGDGVDVLAGTSWVDAGPALAAVGRPDLGQLFGYLQLRVVF